MGKVIQTRLIVALLLSLAPEELINFRETPDGGAIAIAPTGAKYKFTAEELAAKEFTLSQSPEPVEGKVEGRQMETEARALISVEGSGDSVSIETEEPMQLAKSVTKKLKIESKKLKADNRKLTAKD